MLAWVLNMGFAASEAGAPAVVSSYSAPYVMGMGDELWLMCLALVSLMVIR